MDRPRDVDLDRRRLLKQAGLGAGMLALPGLLAACGDDDSAGSTGGDTTTTGGGETTSTAAGETTTTAAASDLDALLDNISSSEVVVGTYGGTTEESRRIAFWDPFTERTGVEVLTPDIAWPLGNEMLAEKVPAEWDAFHASPDEWLAAQAENPDGEYPQVPEIAYEDTVPEWFRPYAWQSFYIAYVPAMLTGTFGDDAPQTWADFFDTERYPGKRAWPSADYTGGVFEAALLADGASPDELYPIDFERARAKIRSIWDDLVFYETFPAVQQLLTSETAAIGYAPNGLWQGLQNQDVDTTVIWTATPLLTLNSEVIMPGAPNLDAVQALAAFCADPERQAEFAIRTNYGPPSTAAFDFMTEEEANNLPNAPGREVVNFDVEWIAENQALMSEQALEMFAG